MNKKIKNLSFLAFSLAILLFANIVFANPIFVEDYFSLGSRMHFNLFDISIVILSLGLEILLGYLFFFRHNKEGVFSLIYANIISYPLFYILTNTTNLLSVLQGEMFAVILETILIKLYIKDEISLKKSFFISILLNILSIIFSVILYFILYIIFYESRGASF